MKVITLLQEKGGCSKSTLCTGIATALHRDGLRVILVDADPQGTARDWRAASPEDADLPAVIGLDRPEVFATSIKSLDADVLVVDTPAKAEKMSATVIRFTNVALIPVQPSGADLWAAEAAVKLVQAKRDVGGQIEAAFIATRVVGHSKLAREMLAGDWNEYGMPLLDSTMSNRVAYAQALTNGVSVYELNDSSARAEIDLLVEELRGKKWL